MSAECGKCGFDIVYPEGTWPVGVCLNCEQNEKIEQLRARVAALEEALQTFRARYDHSEEECQGVCVVERQQVIADLDVALRASGVCICPNDNTRLGNCPVHSASMRFGNTGEAPAEEETDAANRADERQRWSRVGRKSRS